MYFIEKNAKLLLIIIIGAEKLDNKHLFRMPAEWEKHSRTIVSFPVKESTIYPENYYALCKSYADVINAVAEFEPITVLAEESHIDIIQNLCGKNCDILVIPHDDGWFRDNGPLTLKNDKSELYAIHWGFNAWGAKYPNYQKDALAAAQVLDHLHIPYEKGPMILEGGSIHTDGKRTLLTTKECLLNPNRNPDLSQQQIQDILLGYLNMEKVIWLNKGIFNDGTDGHIDNVACFGDETTIFIQSCEDTQDENHAPYLENLEILKNATTADGKQIDIIAIHQPPPLYYRGERLAASYINFYFVNGGILLPTFGGIAKNSDEKAISILREFYPNRKIVPIETLPIIYEGGNIHCITNQIPIH